MEELDKAYFGINLEDKVFYEEVGDDAVARPVEFGSIQQGLTTFIGEEDKTTGGAIVTEGEQLGLDCNLE